MSVTPLIDVICLGQQCETAAQLTRWGVDRKTHIFDWTVTLRSALLCELKCMAEEKTVEPFLARYTKMAEEYDVESKTNLPRDKVWFIHHDFRTADAREKMKRRWERGVELCREVVVAPNPESSSENTSLSPARELRFIRKGCQWFEPPNMNEGDVEEMIVTMQKVVPNRPFSLYLINIHLEGELYVEGSVRDLPNGSKLYIDSMQRCDGWWGHCEAWRQFLVHHGFIPYSEDKQPKVQRFMDCVGSATGW